MDSSMEVIGRLNARIERLERSQRATRRLAAAALVVVGGVFMCAAASPKPGIVDATEFRVVDADGRVRATLGPSTVGRGGFHGDAFSAPTTALRVFDSYEVVRVLLQAPWDAQGLSEGGSLVLSAKAEPWSSPTAEAGSISVSRGDVLLHAFPTGLVFQEPNGGHVALGGGLKPGLVIRAGLQKGQIIQGGGGLGLETSGSTIKFFDSEGRPIGAVP